MNASDLSTQIARGTFLLAVIQSMPHRDVSGSCQEAEWLKWAEENRSLVPLARRFQSEMFETALRV